MQIDINTAPESVQRWFHQAIVNQISDNEDVVFVDGHHLLGRFKVATPVKTEADLKPAVEPDLEVFNFDLARMERMLDTEFVEMPNDINTLEEFDAWLAED